MSLTIEQFTAWVTVDDVEVPLYGIEYSADGKQATCWIASEAGKTFAVHWKDPECTFITSGYVSVDGLINPGLLIRPGLGPTTAKCYSTRTSATHRRPFMFSTLELTDDDNYLNRATSPELGNIQLQLEHVTITGNAGVDNGIAYKAPEKIHERAKKAMGHRIQLGDEIAAPPGVTYSCSRVRQIGTFLFKYRPLEHLQANGIVPVDKGRKRAAPPEDILDLTLDNNDDVDDSQAQRTKNKAEKRMQHLEKELSTLKQKYGPNAKRVKVEVKSEPKAGPSFVDGEIIDLT